MTLTGLVECHCGMVYEGTWTDDSDTMQDMDEAPSQIQVCPGCCAAQYETYPGWVNHTEAG